MSDVSGGPGWWLASDDKWYPPDLQPAPLPSMAPSPGWWAASDGKWYPPEHASRLQAIAIAIAIAMPSPLPSPWSWHRHVQPPCPRRPWIRRNRRSPARPSSGQEETCMALGSGSCGGRRHHHRVRRCVGWQEGHDRWLHADHRGSSVAGWDHRTHLHPSDIAPNHHSVDHGTPHDGTADHGRHVGGSTPVQERRRRAEPAAVHGSRVLEGVGPHLVRTTASNRAKPESANGAGATGSGTFIVDIDGYGSDSATTDEGPERAGDGRWRHRHLPRHRHVRSRNQLGLPAGQSGWRRSRNEPTFGTKVDRALYSSAVGQTDPPNPARDTAVDARDKDTESTTSALASVPDAMFATPGGSRGVDESKESPVRPTRPVSCTNLRPPRGSRRRRGRRRHHGLTMVMRRLSALAAIATLAVALLWFGPTGAHRSRRQGDDDHDHDHQHDDSRRIDTGRHVGSQGRRRRAARRQRPGRRQITQGKSQILLELLVNGRR